MRYCRMSHNIDKSPPLCNKLHPVGLLPHCFLYISSLRKGIGANKEYNTILFFIGGGFIDGVAYLVSRPIPGISLFYVSFDFVAFCVVFRVQSMLDSY